MKCNNCKNEISRGNKLCPYCGVEIEKKDKPIIIALIVLAVIAVITGIVLLVIILSQTPEKIWGTAIDRAFEITENVQSYDTIGTKINLSLSTSDEFLKTTPLNGMNVDFDIKVDTKNKKGYISADLKSSGKNLIKLDSTIEKSKLYLYSADLYEKPFYLEMSNESGTVDVSQYDFAKMLRIIKEEAKAQLLTEDVLSSSKEKITIDGKTISTKKYTISLTNKQADEKSRAMITNLSNNDEFLQCFGNNADKVKESLQKDLNEEKTEVENLNDVTTYSLYLKGINPKLKRAEFVSTTEEGFIDVVSQTKYVGKSITDKGGEKESATDFTVEKLTNNIKITTDGANTDTVLSVSFENNANIIEQFAISEATSYEEMDQEILKANFSKTELFKSLQSFLFMGLASAFSNGFSSSADTSDTSDTTDISTSTNDISYSNVLDMDEDNEDNTISNTIPNITTPNIGSETTAKLVKGDIEVEVEVPAEFTELDESSSDSESSYKTYYYKEKYPVNISISGLSLTDYKSKTKKKMEMYKDDDMFENVDISIFNGEDGTATYTITYDLNTGNDTVSMKEMYIAKSIDSDNVIVVETEDAKNIPEDYLAEFIENTKF